MTDRIGTAKSIMAETKGSLQRLASEALETDQFSDAILLAEWAAAIARLLGTVCRTLHDNSPRTSPSEVVSQPTSENPPTQRTQAPRRQRRKSSSANGKGYPRFFRIGGDLIKEGWSKKGREPYQHRAPKRVVLAVAEAIAVSERRKGEPITAESFMPVRDDRGGEVPAYQSYLCLAWLRQEGLVIQHGRQGYTVPEPAALVQDVERHWNELST